jgi:hypothetical protein
MEYTFIGLFGVEKRSSFRYSLVNPRMEMKSLHLVSNPYLKDETILLFASICQNMQLLDLCLCRCISEEGIVEVLRCCKIMHLNLSSCPKVNLNGMNFQVPKLEVLNLSFTRIDDKTLYVISKSCSGLLHLNLEECRHVTDNGVKQVVENCTRLREINLQHCRKVSAALRKIIPPSDFRPSGNPYWVVDVFIVSILNVIEELFVILSLLLQLFYLYLSLNFIFHFYERQ